MSRDDGTLTLPRERSFQSIAHLVLGGLAVRLDLTIEQIEDLQLALGELLERPSAAARVTVTFRVSPEVITAVVGPFEAGELRPALERDEGAGLGLRRLLETVVDRVELGERDGGHWIELTKQLDARS